MVNGLKINSGRLVASILQQMPSSTSCACKKRRRGRKKVGGWSQMSLNSFIVQDSEDSKKVNSHRHIWEKLQVIFYLYLPFTIEPSSWFLVFLAVPCVVFSPDFDVFLNLCFRAFIWSSGQGCWVLWRHWCERANDSQGRSVDMRAVFVLGLRCVLFAVKDSHAVHC